MFSWTKIKANPFPYVATAVAILGGGWVAFRKYAAGGVCKDVADLNGQVIIITGSNSGIGIETAKALAKMNGHVIIACRDEKKGKDAVEIVKKETGNQKVESMILDLSSFRSVRKFASDFNDKNLHLNILINNAGVMACPYSKTVDGNEMQFGTNHLGHFLLTNLLLEKLKQSRGRIVNLSSALHKDPVDLDDPNWEKNTYDKWKSYSASKAANILFTVELERRLAGTGVQAFAVHPGVIKTELGRHLGFIYSVVGGIFINIFGKNTVEGSQTSIYAAISPKVEGKGGSYLQDCQIVTPASHATNPERAKKLWELSEKMVGFTSQ